VREAGSSNSKVERISADSNPPATASPVVPAKWKFSPAQHLARIRHDAVARPSTSLKITSPNKQNRPAPNSLVHLTSFDPSVVPFAETIFVVIDTEPMDAEHVCPDQPVQTSPAPIQTWQIEMWHFLIFHPPADQTIKPQKET